MLDSALRIGNTNWFAGSRYEPIPSKRTPADELSKRSKTGRSRAPVVSGEKMFLLDTVEGSGWVWSRRE